MASSLRELDQVVGSLVIVQAPDPSTFEEGEDSATWLQAQRFVLWSADPMTGVTVGIRAEEISAFARLARSLRGEDTRYARGTQFGSFAQQVFNETVRLKKTSQEPLATAVLQTVKDNIRAWFDANSVPQRHLIPCRIIPYAARPVAVGPVTFHPADGFDFTAFGVHPGLETITAEPFIENMRQQAAAWIASVEITGIEQVRSAEMADLAVDVALAVLQLVVPHGLIDSAVRITGRSLPSYVVALVNRNGHVAPSISRRDPGASLSGGVLDEVVDHAKAVIESAGRRLATLVAGTSTLPKLDMAWCNSAFWFHEAIAEPLATVAVAKLETSIENLFAAGNLKESTSRILQAVEGVFGHKADQPIAPGATMKVKEFVVEIVTSRSRILHGTWSTLTDELPLGRKDVEALARDLLISFTLRLDRYAAIEASADTAKDFLDWITSERARQAELAKQATSTRA